ncbi:MAG: xylulokinase [Rubrobacteraceae bacterium]
MLLGVDLGTGSVKVLLVDESGTLLGEGSAPYAVDSPRAGWAETSPEAWWEASSAAAREAVGDHGRDVTAVGLSGQMNGVVLSDGDGRPLRPAVLWADARSGEQLAVYEDVLDDEARRRLGSPPAVGFTGPTLLWLRDNEPESYSAARWALQPKDWLRLRLTGKAMAEPSDASATLLYDLPSDDWNYEVAEALGLRGELLAPLTGSWEVAGQLTEEAAGQLGVSPGLPVAAGAGDTAAAMLGTGLLEADGSPGDAQLTVGTGGQIVVPRARPEPDPNRSLQLHRAAAPDLYYFMAAVQNAGLALEWARKLLGASWDEVYEEAFAVQPGAGGVSFLPYLSGERTPHFDPGARGAWTGLGLNHGREHLLRAALEGVAFSLRDGVEALEAAGAGIPNPRLAGGGVTRGPWRQLLADVLARPLRLLPDEIASTASARGAALLAGVASGAYSSVADTRSLAPEVEGTVEPAEENAEYEAAYQRYQELYPRLEEKR